MSGRWRVTLLAAALAAVVSACGSQSPTSPATSTKQLEVVSWWTSRSESAALNELFAAFRQSNPGVTAINGAVPGGAGSNAIVALAKRLQRNDPPDVWQTFAGKSVQGYASRGVIRSVASIFAAERLSERMNPTILGALMHDHQPYGVPTGAHRS
ncbi:MAG: ABC transporter substrate-binding protein, partial [Solirubrobacteraceae bacterium]